MRAEFIDPLLQVLGWDVHNVHGRGEHDKDVIHEDAIRVDGKTLAPDYSFRVGKQVFPGSKETGGVAQGGRRPGLPVAALFVEFRPRIRRHKAQRDAERMLRRAGLPIERIIMSEFSNRMKRWLDENRVNAEFLAFDKSVHTVQEAVEVSGYPVERFTKSIVMLTTDEQLVIAVVPADTRASTNRVRKALCLADRPRVVTREESAEYLDQQLGGNSPLNAPNAIILIDPKVLEREWILIGGGDDRNLVKISIAELERVVTYVEARVRK